MYQYPEELYHWGIKGMKWGIRRYQNPDGTLTAAGKARYGDGDGGGGGGERSSAGAGGRSGSGSGSGGSSTRARTLKRVGIALGVVGGLAAATAIAARRGDLDGVRQFAEGALRKVGDWAQPGLENAAKTVGIAKQNVGRAVDQAGDWARGAARDVGDWAGRVGNDAAKTVGIAKQNVGRTVDRAVDRAGDWVQGAARDVGDWAGRVGNDAARTVAVARQNAEHAVGQAAKNVSNWTQGAARDVSNWTQGAARDVSNWTQGAARDVGRTARNVTAPLRNSNPTMSGARGSAVRSASSNRLASPSSSRPTGLNGSGGLWPTQNNALRTGFDGSEPVTSYWIRRDNAQGYRKRR